MGPPFIVSIWQRKGNIKRKRGQNIYSGASFSIRDAELVHWRVFPAAEEFVWERTKRGKERLHENRRHLCHCSFLQLHLKSFLYSHFPTLTFCLMVTKRSDRIEVNWPFMNHSDVEIWRYCNFIDRPETLRNVKVFAKWFTQLCGTISTLWVTPWFPWESADTTTCPEVHGFLKHPWSIRHQLNNVLMSCCLMT